MSMHDEFDPSCVRVLPMERRKSKVHLKDFIRFPLTEQTISLLLEKLSGDDSRGSLVDLANAIKGAKQEARTIAFMMGGHVVKTGVSPAIIELMKAGFATVIGMPGSTAIHDFEIALWGRTSEPVEEVLECGEFGMAEEPAQLMNAAILEGRKNGEGLGEALGRFLLQREARNSEMSLLATAYSLGIPATVHVTVGADVIHMHPGCDGASLGETSLRDFRIFVAALKKLGRGVAVNIGSAVVMPEVFLKAVSILRNQSIELRDMVTANLDRTPHYRPTKNVIERPAGREGKGLFIEGEHEILVPLLAAYVLGVIREK